VSQHVRLCTPFSLHLYQSLVVETWQRSGTGCFKEDKPFFLHCSSLNYYIVVNVPEWDAETWHFSQINKFPVSLFLIISMRRGIAKFQGTADIPSLLSSSWPVRELTAKASFLSGNFCHIILCFICNFRSVGCTTVAKQLSVLRSQKDAKFAEQFHAFVQAEGGLYKPNYCCVERVKSAIHCVSVIVARGETKNYRYTKCHLSAPRIFNGCGRSGHSYNCYECNLSRSINKIIIHTLKIFLNAYCCILNTIIRFALTSLFHNMLRGDATTGKLI
jgi:hypothetical protein